MSFVCELNLEYLIGESVDLSGVLRYWVRYWDFLRWIDKSGDFVGIFECFGWVFLILIYLFF